MRKAKAAFFVLLLSTIILASVDDTLNAQCYGSLSLSSDFFGYDYIVRLCVHFGDISSLPSDVICSRGLVPGESPVEFPIYAYNLHSGVDYLEFSIESNDSISNFVPDNGFYIVDASFETFGSYYRLNLKLESGWPICGPVLVGTAEIMPVRDVDPIWADLVPNRLTGEMIARDRYGSRRYLFSPKHGGYVGANYLYACQEPICEEPNRHVTDVLAISGPSCSVKVQWVGGGGTSTLIRYRYDRFPSGYSDGEFLLEVPTMPGQWQFYYHTGIPEGKVVYYSAFSLTRDSGGSVALDSFVECVSADTVITSCVVSVKESSWSSIKSMYK
jgi:hypothetical protein